VRTSATGSLKNPHPPSALVRKMSALATGKTPSPLIAKLWMSFTVYGQFLSRFDPTLKSHYQ